MEQTLRRALLTSLLIACSTTTAHAEGKSVIYICAVDRSVGWEARSGGNDAVGQFKPSEDRIFVKWLPASPDDGTPLVLPRIEITEGGKPRATKTLADCDFRQQILMRIGRERMEQSCREQIKSGIFTPTYGTPTNSYSFDADPGERRPSIRFTSYLNIIANAYLDLGTCVLADQ